MNELVDNLYLALQDVRLDELRFIVRNLVDF